MAEIFTPRKMNLSEINGGVRYENGDIVDANAINAPIEAAALVQSLATNQPDTSEINQVGYPQVSIVGTPDYETGGISNPKFKFKNMKPNSIEKIELAESYDNIDYYAITFSNGAVFDFPVRHGESAEVVQTTGNSTTAVMSQKAVTNEFNSRFTEKNVGNNLFDGVYLEGYSVTSQTSATEGTYYSVIKTSSNSRVLKLPIKPNTTYTIVKETSSLFRIATATNADYAFHDRLDGSVFEDNYSKNVYTFTSGNNDVLLFVQDTYTGQNPFVQIVEGVIDGFTTEQYKTIKKVPTEDVYVYSKDEVYSKEEIDLSSGRWRVTKNGDSIRIITNGNGVLFSRFGCNNLMHIKQWIIKNTEISLTSDTLGPYKVYAINNANGDGDITNSSFFTGGIHGFGGSTSSSVSATARMIEYTLSADGVTITEDGEYSGNIVILKVTNNVQACNTCLRAGGGREVLTEETTYTFDAETGFSVLHTIKALEDIRISAYYGFQLGGFAEGIKTIYTDEDVYTVEGKPSANVEISSAKRPYAISAASDIGSVTMMMDRVGLGSELWNQSVTALVATTGKAYYHAIYWNAVSGKNVVYTTNQKVFMSGKYLIGKSPRN